MFGDKQPQGPNANRAVKPDGRGKICSRFGRIKHYIARPAGAVMLRNADAQQKSTFSAFARSVLARDPGDDATRPAAVPSHGSGGLHAGSAASASSLSRTAAGVRGNRGRPKNPTGPLGSNRQSFHPAVSKSALNRREMRADQNWPRGFGTLTGIRSSTFWQGRTRGTGPRCWRSWPGIGGSGWPRKSPCGFRSLPRITARSRLADSPGPSGQDAPAGSR